MLASAATTTPALAQRWSCVVDPVLALSRSGPWAVRQLARVLEVWVFRELWHILDNTLYFTRAPSELAAPGPACSRAREVLAALGQWERVRQEHDLLGLRLFWVGDGLGESLIPERCDAGLVARYEHLAAALERRAPCRGEGTLEVAMRDAVALACSLDNAFVLTCVPREGSRPPLVDALTAWGVRCPEAEREHPLLAIERDVLRRQVTDAGLARLVLAGTRLAVVHVLAPEALGCTRGGDDVLLAREPEAHDPWQESSALWYPLC